jgi:hypothetical protein
MIEKVRADLKTIEKVMKLKDIKDASERNKALFNWLEANRDELGGGFSVGAKNADRWHSLEEEIFKLIMESQIPKDCWRAVKLYDEIHHKPRQRCPGERVYPFGSKEGRKLLRGIILDSKQSTWDRTRALQWLYCSLWPRSGSKPDTHPFLDKEEQSAIIKELIPLLKVQNEGLREAAVRAILYASDPPGAPLREKLETKQALEAFTDAYESESPGKVRDLLAEAIVVVGKEEYYQKLTGNPRGILVTLNCWEREKTKLGISLDMKHGREKTYECPTLILEKLDKQGIVSETREMAFPTSRRDMPWGKGVNPSNIAGFVPYSQLSPGEWRVTVKGTSNNGKSTVKWTSEPKTVVIPDASKDR